MLDLVAALTWVRDEITAFGGDPDNITVLGESAGSVNTACLLTMPRARGLFHRAVMRSGSLNLVRTPADASGGARGILAALGLAPEQAGRLWELPAEVLLQAANRVMQRSTLVTFGPVADGEIIPERPFDAIAAGSARGVAVLAGTNRDEMKLYGHFDPTLATLGSDARQARRRGPDRACRGVRPRRRAGRRPERAAGRGSLPRGPLHLGGHGARPAARRRPRPGAALRLRHARDRGARSVGGAHAGRPRAQRDDAGRLAGLRPHGTARAPRACPNGSRTVRRAAPPRGSGNAAPWLRPRRLGTSDLGAGRALPAAAGLPGRSTPTRLGRAPSACAANRSVSAACQSWLGFDTKSPDAVQSRDELEPRQR